MISSIVWYREHNLSSCQPVLKLSEHVSCAFVSFGSHTKWEKRCNAILHSLCPWITLHDNSPKICWIWPVAGVTSLQLEDINQKHGKHGHLVARCCSTTQRRHPNFSTRPPLTSHTLLIQTRQVHFQDQIGSVWPNTSFLEERTESIWKRHM